MKVSEEDANWLRIVSQNAASIRYRFGKRHLNLLAYEIAKWGPRIRTRHVDLGKTFVLSPDAVAANY